MGKNKNKNKKLTKQESVGESSGISLSVESPDSTIGDTGGLTKISITSAAVNSGDGAARDLSSPSGSSDLSTMKHEHLPDWNPMLEVAKSALNTNTVSSGDDMNAIGKLVTGVGDLDNSDVLCPYNDGRTPKGGCYKVSCPYKHVPYSSKVLNELPKLQAVCISNPESTSTMDLLRVQRLPANDCISKVSIPTAFHPGNFYVIPEKGWNCLCKSQDIAAEEHSAEVNCFEALKSLQQALQSRFQNRPFPNQQNVYLAGELVAVRMSTINDSRTFFRAKVLTDSDNEDDIFNPVNVELQLLDFGLSTIKSSLDISSLPIEFCRFSPLAYKCELFGVSPIMGSWSSLAVERFKCLVTDHYVIAEVVRTGSPLVYSLGDTSCLVNLYVKSQNGDFIDIAQHLIETGLGIEWNMYLKRPGLNEILEGRLNRFALTSA